MLIQMCKISKVFSINFILIRCGSVPYNYKTENIFVVCHMIRHTAKDFAVCHSTGYTAKDSIERCQKVLRTKCKNKCKIEASIADAYILEEVSNFTSKYYTENLPSVHNPPSRYNAGEADSNLSLFKGQLGSASVASIKTLNFEEWRSIMLYVLTNLSEVQPYIQ